MAILIILLVAIGICYISGRAFVLQKACMYRSDQNPPNIRKTRRHQEELNWFAKS